MASRGERGFQAVINVKFKEVWSVSDEALLTHSWLEKLLKAYRECHEEFNTMLKNNLSRHASRQYFLAFTKMCSQALETLSSSRDGLGQLRDWLKHFEDDNDDLINFPLLEQLELRSYGSSLSTSSSSSSSSTSQSGSPKESEKLCPTDGLENMSQYIIPPTDKEKIATDGFARSVYTMKFILFVMASVIVAAIPNAKKEDLTNISAPAEFMWASNANSVLGRVLELYGNPATKSKILLRGFENAKNASQKTHELDRQLGLVFHEINSTIQKKW